MQNVINSMTPFIDPISGLPLSAGRVAFVMLDTDDRTRYIDIKDVNGTSLENPLPLDDSGRFTIQPFADDGVDFKMIVEKRVDLPVPEERWLQVAVIFQKSSKLEVDYSGAPVVSDLSALRTLAPENGTAIVLGYASAGDFCPVRVFQWVEDDLDENYGTHVKSSLEGASGTWVCSVGDVVDVRLFGINPAQASGDDSARLAVIVTDYPDATLYFPSGNYFFSQNFAVASAILDKGACMRTTGERNVNFTAGHMENRGGKFYADDNASGDAYRVVPCADGDFHTSACVGTINEFITSSAIANVDAIIFDNAVTEGTHSKTFTGSLVIAKYDIPSSLTFDESVIIDLKNRKIITLDAKVGELSVVDSEYTRDGQTYACTNFYFGANLVATMNAYDGIKAEKAYVETLTADVVNAEKAVVKNLNIPADGNTYVIETNSDFDIAAYGGNRGDLAIVVNTKDAQITVTIMRITEYMPTPFHNHFQLNSSNGVLLYCTDSYAEPGPMFPTGKNAIWVPLNGQIVVQHTEDA